MRRLLWVFGSLSLVVWIGGCTAVLGDFTEQPAEGDDGGTASDGSSSSDGTVSSDANGSIDAPGSDTNVPGDDGSPDAPVGDDGGTSDADADAGPTCGLLGMSCCAGDTCADGTLNCINHECHSAATGDLGKPCSLDNECQSGVCLAVGQPLGTDAGYTGSVCTSSCSLNDGGADAGDAGDGGDASADAGDGGLFLECISGWTCTKAALPVPICKCQYAAETCDGKDDDCDGVVDNGDPGAGSCNTGLKGACAVGAQHCVSGALTCTQTVFPTTEICNGADDNCEGHVDENDPDGGGACSTGLFGECAAGIQHCQSGALKCVETTASSAEVCDGKDNDCNNQIDDGDPGGGGSCSTGLLGVCAAGVKHCKNGGLQCVQSTQSSSEVCDGLDNNCNGTADEGVKNTYYRDADGDGYGNPGVTTQACTAPSGYTTDNTDCNDSNNAVHPGATEVCNGIDDNCNTQIDEGVKSTFYRDADGDTYGDPNTTTQACAPPGGYVVDNTDCNDSVKAIHPGATEICNGLDDNCNNQTDETFDFQNDPANCSVCGHSCGGGKCVTATCQPWAIASSRPQPPLNIALDPNGNNIFWTENNSGGVYQMSVAGGPVGTVRTPDNVQNSSWAVVSDGTNVYWTDRAHGTVGGNTIGGAASSAWTYTSPNTAGAAAPPGPYGITVAVGAATYIYAADFTAGHVWYVNAASHGATGTNLYTFSSPTGMSHVLYNSSWYILTTLYNTGTVYLNSVSQATGTNVDSRYVTSDGTYVYWTASDGNQVWSAPITTSASTSAPTAISTSESQPWGIATDGTQSVYWVNKTDGTIRHAVFAGGKWAVSTIATGNGPSDIRVDAKAVYWADFGSNSIMRVNK